MWCSTETESGLRDAGILAKSAAEENENLQLLSSRVKALIVPPVTRGQSMKTLGSSSSANLSSDRDFLKHKKVLLVEDDPVIRKTVHRMLLNMNCEVTVTSNGREALDILQRTPVVEHNIDDKHEFPAQFDLVLMDLHMPVMDGTHAVWFLFQTPSRL
jgi:PleD family two-component response regulator